MWSCLLLHVAPFCMSLSACFPQQENNPSFHQGNLTGLLRYSIEIAAFQPWNRQCTKKKKASNHYQANSTWTAFFFCNRADDIDSSLFTVVQKACLHWLFWMSSIGLTFKGVNTSSTAHKNPDRPFTGIHLFIIGLFHYFLLLHFLPLPFFPSHTNIPTTTWGLPISLCITHLKWHPMYLIISC